MARRETNDNRATSARRAVENRISTVSVVNRQVNFTQRQYDLLTADAARLGIDRGELIRRIIDRHFEEGRRLDVLERRVLEIEARQGIRTE
jgi:hypothetical protein